MTDTDGALEKARAAYEARDWHVAREQFRRARSDAALEPEDIYRLSNCSWWLGDIDDALDCQRAAFQRYVDSGETRAAAMVALDIGYSHSLRGDDAQATGWLSRGARMLEDEGPCPERAHLLYLSFEQALAGADLDVALDVARKVEEAGHEFGEPNLRALGVLGQGRVLVKQGRVADGMALLDEAMVAAIGDALEPAVAGNIYCHLMAACHEIADLGRAQQWTEATRRWCESMPGAGPFMGICRVHRAQTLHALGAWDEAEREATRVCEDVSSFSVATVAEAHYELGEMHRHRHDHDRAEAAYINAHRLGRDPQPGLALLRLAQGRAVSAAASIERVLSTAGGDPLFRIRLLPAAVEIFLSAGELDRARAAQEELAGAAGVYDTIALRASALTAAGRVHLAAGELREAAAALREAVQAWERLRTPYEAACTRVLLAEACDRLGDREGAALERSAADAELQRLGVSPTTSPALSARRSDGLTPRQAEILALVADGRSNQEIADELVLSVRTVERHLATSYQQLGLHGRNARAAAVRWALDQGLTRR